MEVIKYEYQGTNILYPICKYQFLNWGLLNYYLFTDRG